MRSFVRNDSGATAIEYGMIVAMIAVVILGALTLMGDTSGDSWASSLQKISDAI